MTTPATSPSPGPTPPVHGSFARNFENLAREHGFERLRVEGTIPDDLEGTLYRNGGGLFERFGERVAHWFDADGAVSAVRLKGGAATGAVKIVRTRALAEEQAAGRRLYGGYNTPFARPFQEALLGQRKNPGNTSVIHWQRRAFAACEGGLPVEFSTEDLATVGETSFGDHHMQAVSAHPHDVPGRKAIYGYGIRRHGRDTFIDMLELPYQGRARYLGKVSVKGPRMIHDFVATERHLVFLVPPFFLQIGALLRKRGGPMDTGLWKAEMGTEIIIVPIDAPANVTRITAPAFLAEHVVNAFEDKGSLIFDFIHYADMDGLERYVGKLADGVVRAPLASTVRRGIIDLSRRTVRFEERLARPVELPRVSPRVDARPHRFAYFAGFSSAEAAATKHFDAVVKADLETGRSETVTLGPDQFPSEAIFVPRKGKAGEDDGTLLTLVYNARTHTSHLAFLDARNPSRAPLARAHFDHAIPFGFHGVWVGAT